MCLSFHRELSIKLLFLDPKSNWTDDWMSNSDFSFWLSHAFIKIPYIFKPAYTFKKNFNGYSAIWSINVIPYLLWKLFAVYCISELDEVFIIMKLNPLTLQVRKLRLWGVKCLRSHTYLVTEPVLECLPPHRRFFLYQSLVRAIFFLCCPYLLLKLLILHKKRRGICLKWERQH